MEHFAFLVYEYLVYELIFDLITSHISDRTHLIYVSFLSSINLSSNYSNDCVNNYAVLYSVYCDKWFINDSYLSLINVLLTVDYSITGKYFITLN